MSNIQKTLDSLQPYVIGIRYLKGIAVVDMVLNEGWTVPDEPLIKKVKGDETMNYHMIFSEEEGVGLDELLLYVEKVIKLNLDREKKHDLLKAKVNELKEVFKKNSLSKLQKLRFTFGEEDFTTSMSDIDLDIDIPPIKNTKQEVEIPLEEEIEHSNPSTYLDENKNPIELTEEDREMLEEEARAERNRKILESQKSNYKSTPTAKKVELPPRRKLETTIQDRDFYSDCECGPEEACEKCIDKKGY